MPRLIRIPTTALVTVTREVRVDEDLIDAAGGLTTTVRRLDGTAIVTGAATGHPGVGTYTYPVPAQPDVDLLTLDWTGSVAGATVTMRDVVEVVGGFLFDLDEGRAMHTSLADRVRFPTARLAATRTQIEQEFESILGNLSGFREGAALVPRFARDTVVGRGHEVLRVRHPWVRRVRAVTTAGVAWDAGAVAALRGTATGGIVRPYGAIWPIGLPVTVEYEHGLDLPPEELSVAGKMRLRSLAAPGGSGIPERAVTVVTQDGANYRLSLPDRTHTGVPEVDGTLARHAPPRAVVFA